MDLQKWFPLIQPTLCLESRSVYTVDQFAPYYSYNHDLVEAKMKELAALGKVKLVYSDDVLIGCSLIG